MASDSEQSESRDVPTIRADPRVAVRAVAGCEFVGDDAEADYWRLVSHVDANPEKYAGYAWQAVGSGGINPQPADGSVKAGE
jgi:hypothetical protein